MCNVTVSFVVGEGRIMNEKDSKGLIHVYTGNGKGKTTTALGLVARRVGLGKEAVVIQFVKGDKQCGEHYFSDRTHSFKIIQPSKVSSFSGSQYEIHRAVLDTLAIADSILTSGEYDLVVLDEVLTALHKRLLSLRQVVELIEKKPEDVELVLTGRGALEDIIRRADIVTEMMVVKHPYEKGMPARKGIEY